jgi:hypothetical protein
MFELPHSNVGEKRTLLTKHELGPPLDLRLVNGDAARHGNDPRTGDPAFQPDRFPSTRSTPLSDNPPGQRSNAGAE